MADNTKLLDELLKKIANKLVEDRDSVPQLHLKKDDPRINYKRGDELAKIMAEVTVPGAYKAGYFQGLSCETISVPIVKFLFTAGDELDVREEFTHIVIRAIALALGQYVEHICTEEALPYVATAVMKNFGDEFFAALELAVTRRRAMEKAAQDKKPC